jgi:GNAT superfamily N-acetyltransferase
MEAEEFNIRKIRNDELSLIRDLAPTDWKIDLGKVYSQHYDQDYFYPVIAEIESEIVGTGIAIVNDNSTWLGTIIVKEEYRNKGIGKAITNHLINHSKSGGIDTIILAASESGLPVYRKIGFEHDLDYLFFKTDNLKKIETHCEYISAINKNDYPFILRLDFAITGEKREKLLMNSLVNGIKYQDEILRGYYLPEFGTGLIVASSEASGIELLKYKLSVDPSPVCIPETNKAAIQYLNSAGYYRYFKTPRMFLNKNVNWDSKNIFSRGCGYLG